MGAVRLAVIFYSTYGTNHRMAEIAAQAARDAHAEVRLRRVHETAPDSVVDAQAAWRKQLDLMQHIAEVTPDDMEWANAYLFSCPTRFGVSASQLRAFIDTLGPLWKKGALADKAVTAMTSASTTHGGQESTLLGLYTTMMHWGAIIVPPGYTDPLLFESGGNPYGTSVTAGENAITDQIEAAIKFQAHRLVRFAGRVSN